MRKEKVTWGINVPAFAQIHKDPRIVDRRLSQLFNSTRGQWIDITKSAVAARARCTDDNALSAPGYYAWDGATTRMRQIFRREGWVKEVVEGVELIVHHELKKRIAVLNTDDGTCDPTKSPRNRTIKGAAAKQVIDLNNQGELFAPDEVAPAVDKPHPLYYLCVFDDGKRVRVELSKPSAYMSGYVVGYSERIFIIQGDDWEKILLTPEEGAPSEEIVINVRRKP